MMKNVWSIVGIALSLATAVVASLAAANDNKQLANDIAQQILEDMNQKAQN